MINSLLNFLKTIWNFFYRANALLFFITFILTLTSMALYSVYGPLIFLIVTIFCSIYPICLFCAMFYYGVVMQVTGGIKKLFNIK